VARERAPLAFSKREQRATRRLRHIFEAYTEKHDDYRLLCRARRVVGAVLEVDFAKIDAFDAG
jgi:hypothetical protein